MTFNEWYKSRYGVDYDKDLIGDPREIAWNAATYAANLKHQEEIERLKAELSKKINGETSDGYHTFNELYEHRRILTASLFNTVPHACAKSWLHADGTMFDNYFIVGIKTEQGRATYHYHKDFWNDFDCEEVEKFDEWDGHTSSEAIKRIEHCFRQRQKERKNE
jgi:hypothetical protein